MEKCSTVYSDVVKYIRPTYLKLSHCTGSTDTLIFGESNFCHQSEPMHCVIKCAMLEAGMVAGVHPAVVDVSGNTPRHHTQFTG